MPIIKPNYVEACAAKYAPTGEALKKAQEAMKEEATKIAKGANEAFKSTHCPIGKAKEGSQDTYQKAVESLKAQLGF